ncbi:hypothetical protein AURDEDRAFT_173144 [Auricularia subglabra TFB-10046 SS5]|nr:hypothetical protein AURDEDRAFT_173144 [Auricularia subglabra TFB-10046 SS5]
MRSVSVALLALLAATPTNAFIAWSGDNCTGVQGANLPCDGTCFAFNGSHSFTASTPGIAHCVAFYVTSGCTGQPRVNITNQSDQCTKVNTGVNSFRCFAGAACA